MVSEKEVLALHKLIFQDIAGIILGKSKVTYDSKQKTMEKNVFGPLQFCEQRWGFHYFNLIHDQKYFAVPMGYIGQQMSTANGFVLTGVFF